MRILGKLMIVEDQQTSFCWGRCMIKNRHATAALSLLVFLVTGSSLLQHVYSIVKYQTVLKCKFSNKSYDSFDSVMTGSDIIIYDFGLFYLLLGTAKCVANYLDGGYGRLLWCLYHVPASGITCCVVWSKYPRPKLLIPMLFIQSMYFMGLIVLVTATSPKILKAVVGTGNLPLYAHLAFFFSCGLLNTYLTFAIWHFYWYWKSQLKSVRHDQRKAFVRTGTGASRRSITHTSSTRRRSQAPVDLSNASYLVPGRNGYGSINRGHRNSVAASHRNSVANIANNHHTPGHDVSPDHSRRNYVIYEADEESSTGNEVITYV